MTPGRGRDSVNGGLNGAAGDTVSYGDSGRTAGVAVTLNAGAGNDGSAEDESAGQRDTLTDVENVVGTSLADDLSGDVGLNTLSGGNGNDVLRGAAGNDTLNAGDGDDLTSGGDGSDTINGGDGAADTVDYGDRVAPVKVTLNTTGRDDGSIPNDGATANTLDDVENVEVARGGAGNDELVAGVAGSTLVGAAGNDTLTGGAGPDTLDGGAGADTLDGRDGIDRVTYATAPEPVAVSLNDGAANDGGVQDTSGANRDSTLAIENVTGGPGGDALTGDGGPNLLDGGAGNDVLNGAGGTDTFTGGDGDDTIEARDAVAEDVDCGAGTDGGSADLEDRLSACEAVDVPRPGGTPRLFIDTDNDGVPLGVDCDDNDARRFQGNAEIPGNALDEDCLGGPAPFSLTTATFSVFYETRGKRLKLTEWSLRTIPAGAKVRITCTPPKGKSHRKDCPFKTYTKTFTKATKRVSLLKTPLKNKLLTAGTKVRMEVTQPLAIGRVRVITTRSEKLPKDTKNTLCRTPGATKDARCP